MREVCCELTHEVKLRAPDSTANDGTSFPTCIDPDCNAYWCPLPDRPGRSLAFRRLKRECTGRDFDVAASRDTRGRRGQMVQLRLSDPTVISDLEAFLLRCECFVSQVGPRLLMWPYFKIGFVTALS